MQWLPLSGKVVNKVNSVLRIRNDQCKHFKFGFTTDSNPKMGKKGVTKFLFIYVKEPRLKSLT